VERGAVVKRTMRLIFELLTYAESNETHRAIRAPELDDYDDATVHYHLRLCSEAGYLRIKPVQRTVGEVGQAHRRYLIEQLTWKGHEALEAFRRDEVVA